MLSSSPASTSVETNIIAAAVIAATRAAYETCILGDGSENIVDAWTPLNSLNGQTVTAIMNGREVTGTASGIDESGALLLRQEDGRTQAIRAGDVTLKK